MMLWISAKGDTRQNNACISCFFSFLMNFKLSFQKKKKKVGTLSNMTSSLPQRQGDKEGKILTISALPNMP